MLDLDDELMERYQKGDEGAFTLLVRRHQQPLINFIARFINDRDNAEDLAQETFIRIFKAADRYKPDGAHFKTWMYHIAKNLCKNEIRNRERRDKYRVDNVVNSGSDSNGDTEEIDLIANIPANPTFQPEVELERKELRNAIQKRSQNYQNSTDSLSSYATCKGLATTTSVRSWNSGAGQRNLASIAPGSCLKIS